MLYDTHAHLDMLKDLDSVIENARRNHVKIIVAQSVDIDSMKKSLEICKKYPDVMKLSVGLYPEDDLKESDLLELEKFVSDNREYIFAIGEIGMDFTPRVASAGCRVKSVEMKEDEIEKVREISDERKKLQEYVFRKQLELAERLGVPVSIHTRKAEREVVDILRDYPNVKKILHCFSGNFKLVKEAENIGCYFSIPTNIVRSEHFQKMVGEINRDRILTETDSPYLSPFKDSWNEPANIGESIKVISGLWDLSEKDVEDIIENNFVKLYSA